MSEIKKAGFRPSPIFKFMVYRIYRLRDGEAFVRSFETYATGQHFAKAIVYQHPAHLEVGALFSSCAATTWFVCVKLMEPTSVDPELQGKCEYMGENRLSAAQVAYFDSHRVM